MGLKNGRGLFSIGLELIVKGQALPYDIYVNASSSNDSLNFVKIIQAGTVLQEEDVKKLGEKYFQIYIMEAQRDSYLETLVMSKHLTTQKKAEVVKDIAIDHLQSLFNSRDTLSNEILTDALVNCRDTVRHLVDLIEDKSITEIQELIGMLSFHDFYTYDHSINVCMYCIAIYRSQHPNASKDDLIQVGMAGLLHDLGKMKVPTDIINKPAKLTDEEFSIIKTHPAMGIQILNDNSPNVPNVDMALVRKVILQHHENWDGRGYPNNLSGDSINPVARICAIADFFDAITTKRSYGEVLSTADAVALMAQSAGKKLDPTLFENFTKNVKKLVMRTYGRELDEHFDPSQPHDKLPFKEKKATILQSDIFGHQSKKKAASGQ